MLEAFLSWYDDPLFWLFPVASVAISALAFIIFAGPLTLLAAIAPASLERYRIQNRRPRPQQLVWPSLRWWLLNNLLLFVSVVLSWPLLRLTGVHAGPLPAWYVIAAQVLFFILLDDFLYYWMHRAMHVPWLFKRIHGWHHRILTPWAITGHYMHPVEYILTGTLSLAGPLLLGAHVVALWVWFAFRQWEAAEGHCGYELPWTPTHLLPFNDGAIHHDVHHARVKGNYAGFLVWTDLLFGTCARGYRDELKTRHAWAPAATR
jgi:4-alpha-methyl-delta7-sterol-4alpha-methyl oxidase